MKEEIKKFSDSEIGEMISNVNATMLMEGFEPSKENDEIFEKYIRGTITEQEALIEIRALLNKSKK